jgi:hypothetical protein
MLARLSREGQSDSIPQERATLGYITQQNGSNVLPGVDGQNFGANYGNLPLFGDSPEMFDENFFPIGFFDVTNAGPWQWQPGNL